MTRLAIIGLGAFGRLMYTHLHPYFECLLCDPAADMAEFDNGRPVTLGECCEANIIALAVPVQVIGEVAQKLSPNLRPGTLVLDVGSVKVKPARILAETLGPDIDIVCTHPLFGPQSARNGLKGLKVSLCPVRGDRMPCVADFLANTLELDVIETTPEAHDKELAYVQGLTHLIGQTLLAMDLDDFRQTTVSYDLLARAVSFIRGDSVQLFRAIETENPFALDARRAFFNAVRKIEKDLEDGHGPSEGPTLKPD